LQYQKFKFEKMSKLSLYDLDNLYDDEGAVEPCVGCNKKPNIKNVKKTIVKIPKNKKNGN
jgi:hypothetical protein